MSQLSTADEALEFRLLDFHVFNKKNAYRHNANRSGDPQDDDPQDDSDNDAGLDDGEWTNDKLECVNCNFPGSTYCIQIFGNMPNGDSVSLVVPDFRPFFYIKTQTVWSKKRMQTFTTFLQQKIRPYDKDILSVRRIEGHKFYGFDFNKKHSFIELTFNNTKAMNMVAALWEEKGGVRASGDSPRVVPFFFPAESGKGEMEQLDIYESKIPPLLRFFHLHDISPSGWVRVNADRLEEPEKRFSTCVHEYIAQYDDIIPLPNRHDRVPYKIMSFDIEAMSSHHDFPLPVKTYRKMTNQMYQLLREQSDWRPFSTEAGMRTWVRRAFHTAFGFAKESEKMEGIDTVFPKDPNPITSAEILDAKIEAWLKLPIQLNLLESAAKNAQSIESAFTRLGAERSKLKESDPKKSKKPAADNNKTRFGTVAEADAEEDAEVDDEGEDAGEDEDGDEGEEEYDMADSTHAAQEDLGEVREYSSKQVATQYASEKQLEKALSAQAGNNILKLLMEKVSTETGKDELETRSRVVSLAMDMCFPQLEGDKISMVGSTFMRYGEEEPYLNHCVVLGSCHSLQNVVANSKIVPCRTERDMLLQWRDLVLQEDPDLIVGYNVDGFDYNYMFIRSKELGCTNEFLKLSRLNRYICAIQDFKTKKVSLKTTFTALASGEYELTPIVMPGRLQFDMLMYLRRSENLSSYKLDDVVCLKIGDDVYKHEAIVDRETMECVPEPGPPSEEASASQPQARFTKVYSKNLTGLSVGNFVCFEEVFHNVVKYANGKKFEVLRMSEKGTTPTWFLVEGVLAPNKKAKSFRWGMTKDEMSHIDIFKLTAQGPAERAIVAKYCIQDCNTVQWLTKKLDVVTYFMEMANTSSVPMSFIITRGQGIKLYSLVAKECRKLNVFLPTINKGDDITHAYEGAVVLDPKCNLYLETPASVGDFASLYPSSMLSENLCPSSFVWSKTYDAAGNLIAEVGEKNEYGEFIYDNMPGMKYVDISTDELQNVPMKAAGKGGGGGAKTRYKTVKTGNVRVCRFIQPWKGEDGKPVIAIIPRILTMLLKARKDTRAQAKKEPDPFMQNVLEQRQLAYKVTANSLYGQLGAKTSFIHDVNVAACTTATGRKYLLFAKTIVEQCYQNRVVETSDGSKVLVCAEHIYGDTDSVFFILNLRDPETKERIVGKRALALSIEISKLATSKVSKFLKQPHDFEYEKTFYPFCLLAKKRYVSIKYENDPNKGKFDQMGLVLKRRDNAPIVKEIYGGAMDILMKEQNLKSTLRFIQDSVQNLMNGCVPLDKLVITAALRSHYAAPETVAHWVLAQRIGERDPGNKPKPGERIPFVYIELDPKKFTKGQKILRGHRIELPSYVTEHNLKIDYAYYITNQIMKPLLQLLGLVLEDICKDKNRRNVITQLHEFVKKVNKEIVDPVKRKKKIDEWKQKRVKEIMFDKYLHEIERKQQGLCSISKFMTRAGTTGNLRLASSSAASASGGGRAYVSTDVLALGASSSAQPGSVEMPLKTTLHIKSKLPDDSKTKKKTGKSASNSTTTSVSASASTSTPNSGTTSPRKKSTSATTATTTPPVTLLPMEDEYALLAGKPIAPRKTRARKPTVIASSTPSPEPAPEPAPEPRQEPKQRAPRKSRKNPDVPPPSPPHPAQEPNTTAVETIDSISHTPITPDTPSDTPSDTPLTSAEQEPDKETQAAPPVAKKVVRKNDGKIKVVKKKRDPDPNPVPVSVA